MLNAKHGTQNTEHEMRNTELLKPFKWSIRHPDLSGHQTIQTLQTSNSSNTEHGTRNATPPQSLVVSYPG